MKKIILVLLLSLPLGIYAQDSATDELEFVKPSEGKSMVYIARRSIVAFLIKFSIYDGDTFLGKLGADRYFAYECDPGEHVFVAKSENTSYIEANLEANKTYLIDAEVKTGILRARAELKPLDKTHKKFEKNLKKYLEFTGKRKGELLLTGEEDDDNDGEDNDPGLDGTNTKTKHMRKFYEMKQKEKNIKTITPDMYID